MRSSAPTTFFVWVDDGWPDLVSDCVEEQIRYWVSRSSHVDLVESLQRARCPRFAVRIAAHARRRAEVAPEAGGWSVILPGLPIAADGHALDQAPADTIAARRE